MAKSTKKAAPGPAAVDTSVLKNIGDATAAGTFYYMTEAAAKGLLDAGLIEQNPAMVDPTDAKAQATRLLQKGIDFMATQTNTTATAPAADAPAAAKPAFRIFSGIELPASARRGVQRSESYPFSQLEVKQGFFIPATAQKPNPQTTYASTVSSARNRFAEKTSETRVNRKGKTVPVMKLMRDFQIRRVEDGTEYGHPGVAGAVIVRTA